MSFTNFLWMKLLVLNNTKGLIRVLLLKVNSYRAIKFELKIIINLKKYDYK